MFVTFLIFLEFYSKGKRKEYFFDEKKLKHTKTAYKMIGYAYFFGQGRSLFIFAIKCGEVIKNPITDTMKCHSLKF